MGVGLLFVVFVVFGFVVAFGFVFVVVVGVVSALSLHPNRCLRRNLGLGLGLGLSMLVVVVVAIAATVLALGFSLYCGLRRALAEAEASAWA